MIDQQYCLDQNDLLTFGVMSLISTEQCPVSSLLCSGHELLTLCHREHFVVTSSGTEVLRAVRAHDDKYMTACQHVRQTVI